MDSIDDLLRQCERVGAPEYPWEVAGELAAEVRRLRQTVDKLRVECGHLQHAGGVLRAKLASVEALPAKWRKDHCPMGADYRQVMEECHAAELEAALRDK